MNRRPSAAPAIEPGNAALPATQDWFRPWLQGSQDLGSWLERENIVGMHALDAWMDNLTQYMQEAQLAENPAALWALQTDFLRRQFELSMKLAAEETLHLLEAEAHWGAKLHERMLALSGQLLGQAAGGAGPETQRTG